jgi:predicted transcriptional regulator
MSKKVSITLDDEVLSFVDRLASNRSSFINDILWKEKRRIFMQELEDAYKEQVNDPIFQEEISLWDATAEDGLNAQWCLDL